jgi:type VI secretion system secreted protein VgrG
MDKITQANRMIAIETPLGTDVLLLGAMSGSEELGELFEFQLELLSEDPEIRSADIVGQNVTIRLVLGEQENKIRYFNGFVSSFTQAAAAGRLTNYQATVVPWLWFLTRTADCRIFQEMTVPDIIKQVFRDHGFTDFEDSLTGSYRTWEYCVQYRETDFNFVSRLMEQEGIYYFFKHDNGKHSLVLADSPSAHKSYPDYDQLKYHPTEEGVSGEHYVSDWTVETRVQPGLYALNDFDFKNTKKDLQARAKVTRQHASAHFEVYDYPGEYLEPSDGEDCARKRIEQLQGQYEVATAGSDARGISTGSTFTLADHPRDDQNGEYLITSVDYNIDAGEFYSGGGSGGCVFSCSFTAIDASQQFRSAQITPKPSIPGPQTAMVVGPSGDEIYTDEYGRVKVQFHWDRYGKADENSSCWIRVSQAWAGKKWGAMYIPRIGQEVIVEFLEGDPDRPIITGRVYNGQVMPPYDLPGEKTKSTLKSNSSKGGQGFNEIRFEDKKGDEQIFIHAEKNLDVRVKSDRFETIGNNRHLHVVKDKSEYVENNRHEKVDADHMEEIGKDRHLKIKGKEAKEVGGSHSFTVTGDVIEAFNANHAEETAQTLSIKALSVKIEGQLGIELKCGGSSIILTPAAIFIAGGPLVNVNSGSGPPVAPVVASAVAPAAPEKAEDADVADPGKMAEIKAEQKEKKAGKYGSTPVKPYKPPQTEEEKEKKKSWIEIVLRDEQGEPMPGEPYRVVLPNGEEVASGTLDEKGYARVDGFEPGQCQVLFPNMENDQWNKG